MENGVVIKLYTKHFTVDFEPLQAYLESMGSPVRFDRTFASIKYVDIRSLNKRGFHISADSINELEVVFTNGEDISIMNWQILDTVNDVPVTSRQHFYNLFDLAMFPDKTLIVIPTP